MVLLLPGSELCPTEPTGNSVLLGKGCCESHWGRFTCASLVLTLKVGGRYTSKCMDDALRGGIDLENSDQILHSVHETGLSDTELNVSELTVESEAMELSATETESVVIVDDMLHVELNTTHVLIHNTVVETDSAFLCGTEREVDELPSPFEWCGHLDVLTYIGVCRFLGVGSEDEFSIVKLNIQLTITQINRILVVSVLSQT